MPAKSIDNVIGPTPTMLIEKADFYSRLEKSLLEEGFRNPVVLTATKEKVVPRLGGSRIYIAQQNDWDVPAIIADFDNIFVNFIEISVSDIATFFRDKPRFVRPKANGLNISGFKW